MLAVRLAVRGSALFVTASLWGNVDVMA